LDVVSRLEYFSSTFRRLHLYPSSDVKQRSFFLSKVYWKPLVSMRRPLGPSKIPDDRNRSSFRNVGHKRSRKWTVSNVQNSN
jgi:hypothetical protein